MLFLLRVRLQNDVYIEVTSTSPLGSALMKARVGEIVRVDLPKGATQFEILELI